jgi:sirohydrochlorin cobaltochelatase
MSQAILLFAHGSRDSEWAEPFNRLQEMLRSSLPDHRIELAFLESMRPTFAEAAESLACGAIAGITVVPLFLAQGGHLREDIPRLIEQARGLYPGIEFRLVPPLGDVPEVLRAIADWITASQTMR